MPLVGLVEDDTLFAREIDRSVASADKPMETRHWTTAEDFLAYMRHSKRADDVIPDILLLDLNLPGINGIQLLKTLDEDALKSGRPLPFPIVVLTSLDAEGNIFDALRFGAVGYILKTEIGDITMHIENVIAGGGIMSPTIAVRVMADFQRRSADGDRSTGSPRTDGRRRDFPPYDSVPPLSDNEEKELTNREREVLELIVSGIPPREIADTLCVSTHTVRVHIKHIYRKLYVGNQVELMREARKMGLF